MMGSDLAALLTSVNVLVQRFHYLRQDLDLICWPRGQSIRERIVLRAYRDIQASLGWFSPARDTQCGCVAPVRADWKCHEEPFGPLFLCLTLVLGW